MQPNARIYVAGHSGLAGSAIMRRLRAAGYGNLVTRTHAELDLIDQHAVRTFFEKEQPEYVFIAAAKVGGILANDSYPAEFVYQNLAIQSNLIHESYRAGVRHLLFLGSSCIYPRDCPQPMKEEYLLTGPLEPTNRPYAIAKIAGIETCSAYNRQYSTRYLAAMPTNLYGPGDNYDLQSAHVLPALIRKTHEAQQRGDTEVTVWGTGTPRREFLYSDDMADACLLLMSLPDADLEKLTCAYPPLINIGTGEDLTIRELAEIIMRVCGFAGRLRLDASRPDGTPRKLLDVTRMAKLGWRASTSLQSGIEKAYSDYLGKMPGPTVARRTRNFSA